MDNKEKKTCFVSFEVTKELRERINKAAKSKGISRSEFIRNALFEQMK